MDQLNLWFRALKLALNPEIDQDGEWDSRVAALIKPTPLETFEEWSQRCGEHFEELQEYPVIEHKSVGDFHGHFVEDTHEIHLTLDLHFTKERLLAVVGALIGDYQANTPGLPSRVKVAEFALNVPPTQRELVKIDKALKICELLRRGDINQLQIAAKVGIKYSESDANEADAIRQVLRLRAFGRDAVRGVRRGRFPDPTLLPDGRADPSYEKSGPQRG